MPQLITYIKQTYATLLTTITVIIYSMTYVYHFTTHSTTQWTQPSICILQLFPELSI